VLRTPTAAIGASRDDALDYDTPCRQEGPPLRRRLTVDPCGRSSERCATSRSKWRRKREASSPLARVGAPTKSREGSHALYGLFRRFLARPSKPDDNARYLAQRQAEVRVVGLSWRRALIGILGSRASPGSCTIARPPACSIAMSPFVPSLPPPVSMIPMTREPYTLAADRKRGSAAGLV
jgi:hypothetical protein